MKQLTRKQFQEKIEYVLNLLNQVNIKEPSSYQRPFIVVCGLRMQRLWVSCDGRSITG